jgi:putative transposase
MRKRRFSEEEIVRVLREAERGDRTVAEVARAHGVAENSIYRWRQKYAGLSVPETRRLRELEQENGRLKRLLAERDLEVDALRELLSGNS